jgi:hypothetical protein
VCDKTLLLRPRVLLPLHGQRISDAAFILENSRRHISDGTFTTDAVMLLDQHGKLIKKRTSQGWMQPALKTQWAALLKETLDKDIEASEEGRRDNFKTAKRLRAEAIDIRELVMLSQRQPFAAMEAPRVAT